MEKFYEEVREAASKSMNKRMICVKSENVEFVFEKMLEYAKNEVILFMKNYETVFNTESSFYMFQNKLKTYEKSGVVTTVYTFDGKKDCRFSGLQLMYKNFNYVPLEVSKGYEANGFLVVDKKSFMVESKKSLFYDGVNIPLVFNFNEPETSRQYVDFINDIRKNIEQANEIEVYVVEEFRESVYKRYGIFLSKECARKKLNELFDYMITVYEKTNIKIEWKSEDEFQSNIDDFVFCTCKISKERVVK